MPNPPFTIRPFAHAHATNAEYAALNRHMNRTRAETHPDDPPTPLAETIAQMQNIPPIASVHSWVVWNDDSTEMVGSAVVSFLKIPENAHLVDFNITVDRDFRRRGIGRELLRHVVEVPHSEGRRLMVSHTNERIPAGEYFLLRLGAERGLEMHTYQLPLIDVDSGHLERQQAESQTKAAGFELGLWDGRFPDDQIEAIAALMNVMNTAPRDGLDMEDMRITGEFIRQEEQSLFASGRERWTLYAREKATGRFAGFTDVLWNPSRPKIISQGMTGVLPEFRGKGIGRWLKAAMLTRILRDRPQAQFVRTGNADSNAVMLAINRELGFKPYISHCIWQVETEKVQAYLGG